VAKKKVKSRSKKKSKKKTTVAIATTKKKRKKRKKKKRKYKVAKKLEMDDIYRIINKVQIGQQKSSFAVDIDYAVVVENVLRDLNLYYERNDLKTKIIFCVHPPEIQEEDIVFDLDFFEDEILEEGQLF
tara:strand:+ start:304 stop:690 length:387 start_codon:yes stop_codon:yes gene_type:complete